MAHCRGESKVGADTEVGEDSGQCSLLGASLDELPENGEHDESSTISVYHVRSHLNDIGASIYWIEKIL